MIEEDPQAQEVLRRYQTDDDFRQRFASGYRGRRSPQHAVWWFAHPRLATDDDVPAPAVLVEQLHRRLYEDHTSPEAARTYLEAATELAQEDAATARAVVAALAPARPLRRLWRLARLPVGLAIAGACLVAGFIAGGVLQVPASTSPSVAPTSPQLGFHPAPQVSAPVAAGATLARMSNEDAPVGGELQASGTSAFQSRLITAASNQVMLTVTCRGGDSILVVAGPDGLSNGGSLLVSCPESAATMVRTVLARSVTTQPFRVVVYERLPSSWKLLASRYPA